MCVTKYTSVEQGYQHKKALHFQDEVSALKILHSKSSVDAYKLGQNVNGFKSQVWSTQRYNVMESLVRIKFTQNDDLIKHLLNTGNCDLAEAGKKRFYSHWSTPR